MIAARTLISQRVVVGFAEQRLEDLGAEFNARRAHRCVVLENGTFRFLGIVRLADIVSRKNPAMRILADLISSNQPPQLHEHCTIAEVATLLEQPEHDEVVLVDGNGQYFGTIVVEEVYAWLRAEQRKDEQLRAKISYELRTPLSPILLIATEQAAREDLPANARDAFEEIARNATVEEGLIEQFLLKRQRPVLAERAVKFSSPPGARVRVRTSRSAPVVLVVEDHAPSRTALHSFLARRGFMVLAAGTMAEALQLAAGNTIDLVISDVGLPDGTGHQLMVRLREEYGLSGFAMSAFGRTEDVARSKAAGFVVHLSKPIVGAALEKALEAYFTLESAASISY